MTVKRIMRYLKGTINYKLTYTNHGNKEICGYSDSDWASDVDDRKSTTGYIFKLSGGAISWLSKKQQTTALSTAEAEYMAMSTTTQEAIWLKGLHDEMFGPMSSVTIHCDNQGSIDLGNNPIYHAKTKHIDIRHHFLREKIKQKKVIFQHIRTEEMAADFLTKPVNANIIQFCRHAINLED